MFIPNLRPFLQDRTADSIAMRILVLVADTFEQYLRQMSNKTQANESAEQKKKSTLKIISLHYAILVV